MNNIFKLFDQCPAIPLGIIALVVYMAVRGRRGARGERPPRKRSRGPLDTPLFHWTPDDPFTVRDLLTSVLVLGRTGSGKTSSFGRILMTAIVKNRRSGGLILAATPQDAGDVVKVFKADGRLRHLLIFDERNGYRCNFLQQLKRPRDIVLFLMTLAEILKRGDAKGGDTHAFYTAQEERCLSTAVTVLQAAGEAVSAPNLHQFIVNAARTPAELATPEWQAKYQSKCLEAGFNAKKGAVEAHDFQIALDYWTKEWPGMDEKTRANILAGVMGTLHTMNSGLVREMCSGGTNCSPQDVLNGRWLLCDFSQSQYGAEGKLISAGWKQLVQLAVLERHADDNSPFVTIWLDEAHQLVSAFDSTYLAMCRSRKGCMVALTQSVASFYAAMTGEAGRHQADALLANFTTTVVFSCDATSARWAGEKLGKEKEVLCNVSSSPERSPYLWDQMHGSGNASASFSESYQPVLQERVFMVGRTGGPGNGFVCDSVVIRNGVPFASGRNYLRVPWSQK